MGVREQAGLLESHGDESLTEARTSAVIPCFRDDRFLRAAIDSVAKQTEPVREIIVIDDGSPAPLQEPADWRGPPLKWVRTENRGLGAARNEGIERATGEFVAFLDADDLWSPEKIELQQRRLDETPEAVGCYTHCVDEPGFFPFGPFPDRDLTAPELAVWLWSSLFFPPSSMLARRWAMREVGGFAEGLANGEDLEMWIKLLDVGLLVGVAQPLTWYRVHEGQITSNEIRKVMGAKRARQLAIDHHADLLVRGGLSPDQFWDGYRHAIMCVYFRRNFNAARPMLWDYWKSHPSDVRVLGYCLVACLPKAFVSRVRG